MVRHCFLKNYKIYFYERILRYALSVFCNKQDIVIGPTPPGTGVIAFTLSFTFSKSTSPTSFLLPFSSIRLIPTSITTQSDLTQSCFTNFAIPTDATKMSAPWQIFFKFLVFE